MFQPFLYSEVFVKLILSLSVLLKVATWAPNKQVLVEGLVVPHLRISHTAMSKQGLKLLSPIELHPRLLALLIFYRPVYHHLALGTH